MKKWILLVSIFSVVMLIFLGSKIASANFKKAISDAYAEFEKIPMEYPSTLAEMNGDVVETSSKALNIEKLEKFIKTPRTIKTSMVRVTRYSTEGEPSTCVLIKNIKGVKLIFDKYNGDGKREYNVIKIFKLKTWNGSLAYEAKLDNGVEISFLVMPNN